MTIDEWEIAARSFDSVVSDWAHAMEGRGSEEGNCLECFSRRGIVSMDGRRRTHAGLAVVYS